jgi:hypothetical protein
VPSESLSLTLFLLRLIIIFGTLEIVILF